MQKNVIRLSRQVGILSCATVVGKQEQQGPLGGRFDLFDTTDRFGQSTWEKAESEMQHLALNLALSKKKMDASELDALFAGDLLNQCIGSSYGLLSFDAPFFGLYGACSTAAEGLILSALLIEGSIYTRTAAVASSHYCSSERQFRFPLEYGGQRTPTSQWTVTGAGAFLVGCDADAVQIEEIVVGRTVDFGITDINNMGAAMAPAAADTILRYFSASEKKPSDFDLIITGDLGWEGHRLLCDLLAQKGIVLGPVCDDCGLHIYDRERQDKHAGGSGCGCSAVVLGAELYPKLQDGSLRDILWIGTGAMMSPASVQQGASIPAIAHLLHLCAPKKKGGV